MISQAVLFCGLNLFRNRLHHIVDRSCARDRQLHVLDESLVVFGKSLQRRLGFHVNDLVAAGLQAAKQCIRMMPLPDFSSLVRTELMTCVASFALKSNESRLQEKIATLRDPR